MSRVENTKVYLDSLVSRVFKILPLYEENNDKLHVYIQSLIYELNGLDYVIKINNMGSEYIQLLATLESLYEDSIILGNDKEVIRREVFKCLDLIGKMKEKVVGDN